LYDMAAQSAILKDVVPGHPDVAFPPVYGPQVPLLYLPLAYLPYESAMYVWMLLTAVVYAVCCRAIWRRCPRLRDWRYGVIVLAIASPALRFTLGFGQASAIGLACITAAYCALDSKRPFLAGLAVGTLAYKPPLGIAIGVVLVASGEWPIVAGAILAAAAQVAVGLAYWGPSIVSGYVAAIRRVPDVAEGMEAVRYHMHSWRAFFALFGLRAQAVLVLYVIASAVTVAVAWYCWRARGPLALRFGALLAATILVDPHVYVYDLLLLTPVLLVLWNWAIAEDETTIGQRFPSMERGVAGPWRFRTVVLVVLYGCYLTPALGGIVTTTQVQPSVLFLVALVWIVAAALSPNTVTATVEPVTGR
jgi:alpha-1,2-mannosyltransferase